MDMLTIGSVGMLLLGAIVAIKAARVMLFGVDL